MKYEIRLIMLYFLVEIIFTLLSIYLLHLCFRNEFWILKKPLNYVFTSILLVPIPSTILASFNLKHLKKTDLSFELFSLSFMVYFMTVIFSFMFLPLLLFSAFVPILIFNIVLVRRVLNLI